MSQVKSCPRCREALPLAAFHKDRRRPTGRQTYCKGCVKIRSARWYRENPGSHLLRTYGISPTDYDEMLESQGGVCSMCHKPPKVNRLHVDHDHKTGRVRGLLCTRCNTALAVVENVDLMASAESYLKNI